MEGYDEEVFLLRKSSTESGTVEARSPQNEMPRRSQLPNVLLIFFWHYIVKIFIESFYYLTKTSSMPKNQYKKLLLLGVTFLMSQSTKYFLSPILEGILAKCIGKHYGR